MYLNRTKLTVSAMALCAGLASTATAQEVTLVGRDNDINVTGTLLSARDGKFLVATDVGEFIVNQDLVTCEGEACPSENNQAFDFRVSAPDKMAKGLVPILVEGYAAELLDSEAQLLDMDGEPIDTESTDLGAAASGADEHFILALTDFDGEEVANFDVHSMAEAGMFEELASNASSIIFTETTAGKADRALVADGGGGNLRDFDQERVIAVDGYAMVVNPLNDIPSLSLRQAKGILTGDITNWSEVGGSNAPITVYSFDSDTTAFSRVSELFSRKKTLELTGDAEIVEGQSEMVATIMDDISGFGIVNFSNKRDARAVPLESTCGIIEEPTAFGLKTEEYELQERVVAYSRSDIEGYGREFIDYLDDGNFDGLVAKAGYIDLSIVTDNQVHAAERLAAELEEGENEFEAELIEDLLKNMNTHERLSATLRFAPGSTRLDNKAQRDLQRIIDYIVDVHPPKVMFVGFTDNKGPFDPNLLIGQERADLILQMVTEQGGAEIADINMEAVSYGELDPVACNTSPRGRATNRRVEVWVQN